MANRSTYFFLVVGLVGCGGEVATPQGDVVHEHPEWSQSAGDVQAQSGGCFNPCLAGPATGCCGTGCDNRFASDNNCTFDQEEQPGRLYLVDPIGSTQGFVRLFYSASCGSYWANTHDNNNNGWLEDAGTQRGSFRVNSAVAPGHNGYDIDAPMLGDSCNVGIRACGDIFEQPFNNKIGGCTGWLAAECTNPGGGYSTKYANQAACRNNSANDVALCADHADAECASGRGQVTESECYSDGTYKCSWNCC